MEKVESRFFFPTLRVFVAVVRYPPSQPSGAVSSRCAEAPRHGREWGWRRRAAPEDWSIATAQGQRAAALFPAGSPPRLPRAGRGKGSNLPPLPPASSPAQPRVRRAPGRLWATSTPLPAWSNLTLGLLGIDLKIALPPQNQIAAPAITYPFSRKKSIIPYISLHVTLKPRLEREMCPVH